MTTPIRRQYLEVKRRYPHAIVFFRLGDFYETFDDDAKLCARELEITLTSKPMGKDIRVPLAGIPYHALDGYLAKLVSRGYKVALCEQMEDPATAKGIVQREVVRVVTPGTLIEGNLLDAARANYLAAAFVADGVAGLAYADVSTGEFAATEVSEGALAVELARLRPAELLAGEGTALSEGATATALDASWGRRRDAEERVTRHFGAASLAAFGLDTKPVATLAAAAVLRYVEANQRASLAHLTRLAVYDAGGFMVLDEHTRRNLEILAAPGGRALVDVLDATKTPMGARLLRDHLGRPLLDPAEIGRRLDAVEHFRGSGEQRAAVRTLLATVPDLPRLTGRIAAGSGTPRDVAALRSGLAAMPALRSATEGSGAAEDLRAGLRPLPDLVALLEASLADTPPVSLEQGDVIRPGYSTELDELRVLSRDAHQFLADLEQRERERSGIRGLKVGYNRVFGYYIEISNANAAAVPEDYQRRQTLTNAERYITMELKEYESRVLTAKERLSEVEGELFRGICARIAAERGQILALAGAVAAVDVAAGLAEVAALRDYCRPAVDESDVLEVEEGRHPVVEQNLPAGEFIANDTAMSAGDAQVLVLTGPNMAGKSTYLRQVALIAVMAQAGCFVPARSARVGIVDRVFTRIGAHDELASGRSTFMVEMLETAQILHAATPRSLVILDEVGRGTSTYDGMAIARAVIEFLHNDRRVAARTLFATHYHELTELAEVLPRVRNYNVAVAESGGEVVFLRRIVPGGADRSYGVHVAQLAGLPRAVIHRAEELLAGYEDGAKRAPRPTPSAPVPQLSLFNGPSPVEAAVRDLDIDGITPLEAITRLYELKRVAADGKG